MHVLHCTSGAVKARPGRARAKNTMFVLLMSRNLTRSTHERKANGLAYSRCLANTNDLATPLHCTN